MGLIVEITLNLIMACHAMLKHKHQPTACLNPSRHVLSQYGKARLKPLACNRDDYNDNLQCSNTRLQTSIMIAVPGNSFTIYYRLSIYCCRIYHDTEHTTKVKFLPIANLRKTHRLYGRPMGKMSYISLRKKCPQYELHFSVEELSTIYQVFPIFSVCD